MIAKSLQIIFGFIGHAIRTFATTLLLLELVWGGLLAVGCFWIAGDDSTIRGILAAGCAILFVTATAILIAVYFSANSVVRKAVNDAGIGRVIFDNLFDRVLGVKGDDTGQRPETARVPTHMSAKEVEDKMNAAAKVILSDDTGRGGWTSPFFWLAKRIQKITVWATVRVIVRYCSKEGDSINLFHVRDQLASVIDQGVVDYVSQYFKNIALAAIFVVTVFAILVAYGIRYLPFDW